MIRLLVAIVCFGFVGLVVLASPAIAFAQASDDSDDLAGPDWALQPTARANTAWISGRGASGRSDDADVEAKSNAVEFVHTIAEAVATVMFAPPDLRTMTSSEKTELRRRFGQFAQDMRGWAETNVRIRRRWAPFDPDRNATLHISLAGVSYRDMTTKLVELRDEQFPLRREVQFSLDFLVQTTVLVGAAKLHEEWLPRLPQRFTETAEGDDPDDPGETTLRVRPEVRIENTGVLDETRDGRIEGDQRGLLDTLIELSSNHSDGSDYELSELGFSAFGRLAFHTAPEAWMSTARLDTQLIAGARVPIGEGVDLFGTVRATLASDTGAASFDGGMLGIKVDIFEALGRPGGEESEVVAALGKDTAFATFNASIGFPLEHERQQLLDDNLLTIDAWGATPSPLRFIFGFGAGFGVDDFFRIVMRFEPAVPVADLGDAGLLVLALGIHCEWRIGINASNPDRYVFRFSVESEGPTLLFRWRFSGQLGRIWSIAVGWRF